MGEALRDLLRSSSSHHRPWQLAAAISMGILCGLLPKLNLTFCLVGGLCCLLPIHLPMAAVTCLFCSVTTYFMAPVAGQLGIWSLTHPRLREVWLNIDALPLVPWLSLHNSVVHGSLLIGLLQWLPVYATTKAIAGRLFANNGTVKQSQELEPGWSQLDADFAHEVRPAVASPLPPVVVAQQPVRVDLGLFASPAANGESDAKEATDRFATAERELQQLLSPLEDEAADSLSVHQVVQRASQIAQYVDELLTVCESTTQIKQLPVKDPVSYDLDPPVSRPQANRLDANIVAIHSYQNAGEALRMRPNTVPASLSASNQPASHRSGGERELLKRHEHHASSLVAVPANQDTLYVRPNGEARQQEALRYLLHHLKAFKEKV